MEYQLSDWVHILSVYEIECYKSKKEVELTKQIKRTGPTNAQVECLSIDSQQLTNRNIWNY